MTVVGMSHGELSRYDTPQRVERRELRVADAAVLLSLTRRQISRLLIRFRAYGADGLVSRRRGLPSNRRLSDEFRERVLTLVREHYRDFGPTLAAEYLAKRHDVQTRHDHECGIDTSGTSAPTLRRGSPNLSNTACRRNRLPAYLYGMSTHQGYTLGMSWLTRSV